MMILNNKYSQYIAITGRLSITTQLAYRNRLRQFVGITFNR